MATKTSNASGPWSTGATWVGGVAPTAGDLAIIANGHTVTIQSSDVISIGDGTAAHFAISTPSTGILIANDGFSLTLTSGVDQGIANWSIGRGTITYDNTLDTLWLIGNAHNNHTRLDILGQSGNYGTLQSTNTGVLGFSGSGWLSAGLGGIRYYNLTKIGNSSTPSWEWNVTQSGDDITIRDCTFTNCGKLTNTFAMHGTATVIIDDTKWSSTPGAECIGASVASTAKTGGTRSIQGNYFDKNLGNGGSGGNWQDVTFALNFINGIYTLDNASLIPAAFNDNFLVNDGSINGILILANTSVAHPNFAHMHSNAGAINNGHLFGLSASLDLTFDGWFIEPGDTDATGDYFNVGSPASTKTWTLSHNIARLNKNGAHGGMFASAQGNGNANVLVKNNTYYSTLDSEESGSCAYGETYEGHTGIFDGIFNNLVVSNNDTGYVFIRRLNRTLSDGCAAANVHHNGKYRLSNGNLGFPGYTDKGDTGTFAAMFSSTTGLGSGDVTANPNFVDDTRGITTWAVARGYSASGTYNGRVTDAYAAIYADPRTRIPDLISWCRAGFAPTNPAFRGTGSGGLDIGAMDVLATPLLGQIWMD